MKIIEMIKEIIKIKNRREQILFLEKMALYNQSGISLVESLRLSKIGVSKNYGKLIGLIQTEVEAGGRLSDSLTKHIDLSKSLSGLIAQGERSGNLAEVLGACHKLLDRHDELVKKLTSAMIYPFVIGICTVGLTLGLVRGVMPQIIPLLTGMHVTLPPLTRLVIFFSKFITSYGIYFVVVFPLIFIAFYYIYKKLYPIRKGSHYFILFLPIIGNLVYVYSLVLFIRSLSVLISSGINIIDAYEKSCDAITFEPLKSDLVFVSPELRSGKSLSSVFISKRMPKHIAPLILAGETSGNLGTILFRATEIIECDIDHILKRITSLIEPIMMVGMGGAVGGIALSIMLPIYDISKNLQHV